MCITYLPSENVLGRNKMARIVEVVFQKTRKDFKQNIVAVLKDGQHRGIAVIVVNNIT